jgi:hypothetical protein
MTNAISVLTLYVVAMVIGIYILYNVAGKSNTEIERRYYFLFGLAVGLFAAFVFFLSTSLITK